MLLGSLVTGCSSAGSGGAAGDPIEAAIAESGCARAEEQETEEIYVRTLIACDDFDLYVFNTTSARDSWRGIAEEFGTVVVDEGATWLAVEA